MASTVENRIASEAKVLQSYLGGKWQAGAEQGAALVNPTTGETVAWASSKGLGWNTPAVWEVRSCASFLMHSGRSC
jgi:hypothetical protein